MATYKLEIKKRFGKFYHSVYAAGAQPERETPESASIKEVLEKLKSGFLKDTFKDGDSVIFRGIAYEDVHQLVPIVRDADY